MREKIRKRDMYLCQVCLRNGIYNCDNIEVHHAVKIDDDKELTFEPSNLITLCREHHRQADEGEIPLEDIKEIIDEREAKEAVKEIISHQKFNEPKYLCEVLKYF
jgi:5-methylcytosine-specific restriction endonuclease McrA